MTPDLRTSSPLAEPLPAAILGKAAAVLTQTFGIHTVGDLLRHYPRRYQNLDALTPVGQLPLGEFVTIFAEVVKADPRPMRDRRNIMLVVTVTDGLDRLNLTFFNAKRLQYTLRPGTRHLFSGVVGEFKGTKQLTHPDFIPLDDDRGVRALGGAPLPIYPATAKFGTRQIERCVASLLDVVHEAPDPIPSALRERRGLPELRAAFEAIHRPATEADWRRARDRFRFEEAYVLQVALARRRAAQRAVAATPRVGTPGGLRDAFDARLPFTLTKGQRDVGVEIAADLARGYPMQRLLQGEVGSGKTVVALRAMLTVVDSGAQAALLAPTEVLAAQHHRSITAMLGDLAAAGMLGGDERGTRVRLLTGSMPTAARRVALLDAVSGEAGIVVGTHALLADQVTFHNLGLIVVDEQHRFGVEQRDALRGKGRTSPHVLVMTATPIPRTVAMTVFGDLETSTLTQLPAGRPAVVTHVVPVGAGQKAAWYGRVWQRLREELDAGHQAFVVCPRIGDADDPADQRTQDQPWWDEDRSGADAEQPDRPARGVLETIEELRANPVLAGRVIELLHGRMPADERDRTMRRFSAGEIDVLVATTVVEVGVDVPNATVMVVLDADRYGVSQLHQLRGRVGRGSADALCLLVTQAPPEAAARTRLDAVAATRDGFALSRVDLQQRREGDVLGAAQHGRSSLRLLRALHDEKLIEEAREEAIALVAADPQLTDHPALLIALEELLDPEREAYLERG